MLPAVRLSVVLLAVLTLVGCHGSNFVRPADDEFKLGKATHSQVAEKMGAPQTTSESLFPGTGKRLTEEQYIYATYGAGRVRRQLYFFYHDVLVGRQFTSNFPEDSSDWNEFKVDDLVKGKTTRSEVIEMLGHPSGAYIWPAVPKTSGEAIGYHYFYATREYSVFAKRLVRHSKDLIIIFDEQDRILAIDYRKKD